MTPSAFYSEIMAPAARMLANLSPYLDSPQARCIMLAIAGQESAWDERRQVPGGEARGFWQCEADGMLSGVMFGPQRAVLTNVCKLYSVPTDPDSLFEALAWNDPLAYTVARLGLWMDRPPLPAIGGQDVAYQTYLRVWRPGKPSADRWKVVYLQAVAAVS